jgi:hypothetical protein
MKKMKKQTILVGEGIHQHTLYGSFKSNSEVSDFAEIEVLEETLLKHEKPNGEFAEHKGLMVNKGSWVMGLQIQFNPFTRDNIRMLD